MAFSFGKYFEADECGSREIKGGEGRCYLDHKNTAKGISNNFKSLNCIFQAGLVLTVFSTL